MDTPNTDSRNRKRIVFKEGVTYFGKDTERAFFFVVTVIMLALGLLYKFGIL